MSDRPKTRDEALELSEAHAQRALELLDRSNSASLYRNEVEAARQVEAATLHQGLAQTYATHALALPVGDTRLRPQNVHPSRIRFAGP